METRGNGTGGMLGVFLTSYSTRVISVIAKKKLFISEAGDEKLNSFRQDNVAAVCGSSWFGHQKHGKQIITEKLIKKSWHSVTKKVYVNPFSTKICKTSKERLDTANIFG